MDARNGIHLKKKKSILQETLQVLMHTFTSWQDQRWTQLPSVVTVSLSGLIRDSFLYILTLYKWILIYVAYIN